MNKHEMSLDERISALEARLARREDRDEIENLVAVHQYYMTGNQGERAFDELYADRPDVTNEIGASGVYFGRKKARTYYEKEHVPGRLFVHTLTTPDIVISKDRSTAKGLWFTVGVESDAGDLGPNPPRPWKTENCSPAGRQTVRITWRNGSGASLRSILSEKTAYGRSGITIIMSCSAVPIRWIGFSIRGYASTQMDSGWI